MSNTKVTITYTNGSTREFIASDDLERMINDGHMFSVTTFHSDMGVAEEMLVSKMYVGNPVAAMGHMMMMLRNAETMRKSKSNRIVKEVLTACIKLMSDEITSFQSEMSPVMDNESRQFKKGEPLVPIDMTQMGDDGYEKEQQEKCPAINDECNHYSYQLDNCGQVAIEYCTHPENSKDEEGNCTSFLCPLCTEGGG